MKRPECTRPQVFPSAGFPYTIRHRPHGLLGGGKGLGLAAALRGRCGGWDQRILLEPSLPVRWLLAVSGGGAVRVLMGDGKFPCTTRNSMRWSVEDG